MKIQAQQNRANFSLNNSSFNPATSVAQAPSTSAPPAAVTLSGEARQAENTSGGFGNLLNGLQSWGQADAGSQTPQTGGAAAWADVMKSGQMPMGIIEQVFNTMKNAGGMATAGALHSLLSWGAAEKRKTGQIRPEFQEILREAIEIAKKNKNMSEEDLKKYEDRLFGDAEGGKKAENPKSGKGQGPGKTSASKPGTSDVMERVRGILAKRK